MFGFWRRFNRRFSRRAAMWAAFAASAGASDEDDDDDELGIRGLRGGGGGGMSTRERNVRRFEAALCRSACVSSIEVYLCRDTHSAV